MGWEKGRDREESPFSVELRILKRQHVIWTENRPAALHVWDAKYDITLPKRSCNDVSSAMWFCPSPTERHSPLLHTPKSRQAPKLLSATEGSQSDTVPV